MNAHERSFAIDALNRVLQTAKQLDDKNLIKIVTDKIINLINLQ